MPKPPRAKISPFVRKYDPNHYPRMAYVACAQLGATNEDLAKLFDVKFVTISLWLRKYSRFRVCVRKGRDYYDCNTVERALLQRALGYDKHITEVYEDNFGFTRTVEKVVHVPADVKACIFWLKNRRNERWKDARIATIDKDSKRRDVSTSKEMQANLSVDELRILHTLLTKAKQGVPDAQAAEEAEYTEAQEAGKFASSAGVRQSD